LENRKNEPLCPPPQGGFFSTEDVCRVYVTLKQVWEEVLHCGTKWSHESWTVTDLEGSGREGFLEEGTSDLPCENAFQEEEGGRA